MLSGALEVSRTPLIVSPVFFPKTTRIATLRGAGSDSAIEAAHRLSLPPSPSVSGPLRRSSSCTGEDYHTLHTHCDRGDLERWPGTERGRTEEEEDRRLWDIWPAINMKC